MDKVAVSGLLHGLGFAIAFIGGLIALASKATWLIDHLGAFGVGLAMLVGGTLCVIIGHRIWHPR